MNSSWPIFFTLFSISLVLKIYFFRQKGIKGLIQDIFFTFQIYSLMVFLPSWIFLITCLTLFSTLLIDALLFRNLGIRASSSLIYLIPQMRTFFSSVKDIGFIKPLLGEVFFISFLGVLFASLTWPQSISPTMAVVGALSMIGSWIQLGLGSPHQRKESANFIIWEEWKLLTSFKKKSKTAAPIHETVLPQNETMKKVSYYYPILKETKGFFGEKNFEIPLQQGQRPNVIFILFESLGSKNIGFDQNTFGASPNLKRLAAQSIYFKNFFANGTLSDRALLATLFGILPKDDRSPTAYNSEKGLICLSKHFHENGYKSAYLQGGDLAFQGHGEFLKSHFQKVIGKEIIEQSFPGSASTSWGVHDEYLFKYAYEWSNEQKTPFFLTLFTISSHHPWIIPDSCQVPEFTQAEGFEKKKYLQSIYYADHCLGSFIEKLKESDQAKNTLVFILGVLHNPLEKRSPWA